MITIGAGSLIRTPLRTGTAQRSDQKKADVVEHPKGFGHVGLLVKGSPDKARVTRHLVIRRLHKAVGSDLDCPSHSTFHYDRISPGDKYHVLRADGFLAIGSVRVGRDLMRFSLYDLRIMLT